MGRVALTGISWFAVNGMNAHASHQGAYMLSTNAKAITLQLIT
jgi:hypothetical protein